MKNCYAVTILSGLLATFLISSCTVEKRLHNKGYHIQWRGFKKAKTPEKEPEMVEYLVENESILEQETTITMDVRDGIATQEIIEDTEARTIPFETRATTESIPLHKTGNKLKPPTQQRKATPLRQSQTKSRMETKKTSSSSQSTAGKGAIVAGWVFVIIGFLLLLFVSIAVGLILVVLGLVFIGAGFGKKNKAAERAAREKKQQQQIQKDAMEDVIYLKNGSIIRGSIIELIPKESVKIQTAGGSIFVYGLDEVRKITKEKKIG